MGHDMSDTPSILAVLQARMSSSRLPGKVLKPIEGRPMLGRHIDRLKRCTMIDRLTVATSQEASDDPLAAFCASEGIACYRGPLADVLARFDGAARQYPSVKHVVRLTGDCPLADPAIIDDVVRTHLAGQFDYTANVFPPRVPDGLDAEIMSRAALSTMVAEAADPYEREHVTPFLYRHPERFKVHFIQTETDESKVRWTVDTAADFRFAEAVFRELLPTGPFGYAEIKALVARRPDIAALNGTSPAP
jgi:spore coat polysaccharide biosynthesis protein SpsF